MRWIPKRPGRARAGSARDDGTAFRVRLRRAVPIMLLAASLAVAGLGALNAQRAVRSHRATAELLLRDYGSFAAWSYRRPATDALWGAFHTALYPAIDRIEKRGSPVPLDSLLAYEARGGSSCGCSKHYGAPYYFYISLDTDHPIETKGTSLPNEAMRAWIEDTVRTHARGEMKKEWKEAILHTVSNGEPRYIVYAVYTCKAGQRHAYGFELEPRRYEELFDSAFVARELLPPSIAAGRTNAEMLNLEVVDASGRTLFRSGSETVKAPMGEEEFDAGKGGMRIRAAVRPELAASLIIGGLPKSRLPLLLALFGLSIGLAIVAVGQLRREEELARVRSDFVSSASHELRTPLAQIRLFLETLSHGRYSTEAQRDWIISSMQRETTRLSNLVENVLHFSRSGRNGRNADPSVVDLSAELAAVVEVFLPLAQSRRATIETDLQPGVTAPLHEESFRQLVLNLLDNAVKYGPVGQTIRVALRERDGRARLLVDDEGEGVPSVERERIWEPFRRGEHALGSVAVGSGIGLSVVREIVARHGGTAEVSDAPGGGARFTVELPAIHGGRPPAVDRLRTADPVVGQAAVLAAAGFAPTESGSA